jgi:predicted NBD/HSP70 family sugar kinase
VLRIWRAVGLADPEGASPSASIEINRAWCVAATIACDLNVVLRPRVESDGLPWLLHLVASGQASSRSALSRLAALAPSTTSLKVEALQRAGYLSESGKGESRGGRRPRRLTLHEHAGIVVGVDLGRRHARLAAVDLAGQVVRTEDLELDLAEGPAAVLPVIARRVERLATDTGQRLLAAGIGLPGPVAYPPGITVMPSRMPGWHGYEVRGTLERSLGVGVLVDNDANLMALGEVRGATDAARSMVATKLGGGIGCGVVSDGALVRGVSGAAGDISHVRVAGARDAPCECGRTGCLEAVASGAVLVREARAAGADIRHTLDLIEATEAGDDRLRRTLRTAGAHIGVAGRRGGLRQPRRTRPRWRAVPLTRTRGQRPHRGVRPRAAPCDARSFGAGHANRQGRDDTRRRVTRARRGVRDLDGGLSGAGGSRRSLVVTGRCPSVTRASAHRSR